MFTIGSQVLYVEIRQANKTKRIVLPKEDGILDKLKTFLSEYPYLFLVRQGEAEVISVEVANPPVMIFDTLHFKSGHMINARLFSHPDIPTGSLRYSEELIEEINAMKPTLEVAQAIKPIEQQFQDAAAQQVVVVIDPEEELRNRLMANNTQHVSTSSTASVITEDAPASIPPPPPSGEDQLRRQLEEAKKNKVLNPVAVTPPNTAVVPLRPAYATINDVMGVLETLLTKINYLTTVQSLPDNNITGKQLSIWYATAASEHGFDKAFDILALKLQGKLE